MASNLCQYLEKSRRISNLTMGDLRNVLTGLTGMIPQADTIVSEPDSINVLKCGEHVASVWFDYDQNSFDWYLGVIDGDSYQDEDIIISYMKRGDKNGCRWLFPETAEILSTKKKNDHQT